jgi:hypothetical protein
MLKTKPDDRIYLVTRLVLAAVILVLVAAFPSLYLYPSNTKQNFAWEIKPQLTAVFMGAGYISGAFMFLFVVFGKKWHSVKNSLLPVSTFATMMLVATLLHYDHFLHNNLAFKLWLPIYIITPILVPWLWLHNRPTDPGVPEAGDKIVPKFIRWSAGLVGGFTLLFLIANFIYPTILISIWAWILTPLTSRVVSGWGMLISVGGLVLSREQRWSAWRYNILSIALWQLLMVIGSIDHRHDFYKGSLFNGYFIGILLTVVILSLLYAGMEIGVAKQTRSVKSATPLL